MNLDQYRRHSAVSDIEMEELLPDQSTNRQLDTQANQKVLDARKHLLGIVEDDSHDDADWILPENPDSIVVGALIAGNRSGIHPSRIATALDWDLVRVSNALRGLSRSLITTGHRLLEFPDGEVQVAPLYEVVHEETRQEVLNSRNRNVGIRPELLSVLYRLMVNGPVLSDVPFERTSPEILELIDLGLVVEQEGRLRIPTFVKYSLRVVDGPSLPFGPGFSEQAPERKNVPNFSAMTQQRLTEMTSTSHPGDA